MADIHKLDHGSLCRYHDDEEFCDCGQLAWTTVEEQKARIAALESALKAKDAALATAEDALVYFQEDHGCCPVCARYIKDGGHTNGCLYSEALAAIKEARND